MFARLLAVWWLSCTAGWACAADIHWTVPSEQPVIKPGQLFGELDATRAGAAHVIQIGDKYRMYFWGTDRQQHNRILMATAPVDDPNHWKPLGVALKNQPETDFNFVGPGFPHVVPREKGPWLLYVCGWGKKKPGGGIPNRTCVALSYDHGITWRYADENPILPLDQPYDKEATGSVWVVPHGDVLWMYYTAIGEYYRRPENVSSGHGDKLPAIGIGLATSPDGIHWKKPYQHWLISPRRFEATPYEYICSKPSVLATRHGYYLWFHTFGTHYRVHSATSPDGLYWTRQPSGPDGELGVGQPGAFDSQQRCYLCVVQHNGQLRAWFTGNRFGATGMGYATARLP